MAPKVDPSAAPAAPAPAPDAAPATTPAAPDAPPAPEDKSAESGFEFGGNYTLQGMYGAPPQLLGQTLPGLVRPGGALSVGTSGTSVWVNRDPTSMVRSMDLTWNERTDFAAAQKLGWNAQHAFANFGVNTENWRHTFSYGAEPKANFPTMFRYQIARRNESISETGTTQIDYGFRLSYLYDTSNQNFREGTGDLREPPSIFAPGGYFRLTHDMSRDLSDKVRFNFSYDNQFDLDAFFRWIWSNPQYVAAMKDGSGIALDLSALCGLGGMSDIGHAVVSLDIKTGQLIITPALFVDHVVNWSDPTILPQWVANAGGAVRISLPGWFTTSWGLQAHGSPVIDHPIQVVPEVFANADVNVTHDGALQLTASAHARKGEEANAGLQFGARWSFFNNWMLSANVGRDTTYGDTASLALTASLGGGVRTPINYARGNPNTFEANANPNAPLLDSRGRDRRYIRQRVAEDEVASDNVSADLRKILDAKYPGKDVVKFRDVLEAIPVDQPQLLVNFLDTPEKVAAALDYRFDFPARCALPGKPAPEHPTYKDVHDWGAALLEAHGIDASVQNIMVGDKPEVVLAYRTPDSASGKALQSAPKDAEPMLKAGYTKNFTLALQALNKLRGALPVAGMSRNQQVGLGVELYSLEKLAADSGANDLVVALRDYRSDLNVSDETAQGPKWNVISTYSIAKTDAPDIREAVARYCAGKGNITTPGFFVHPPKGFEWGPDHDLMVAAHSNIGSTHHGSDDIAKNLFPGQHLSNDQMVAQIKTWSYDDMVAKIQALAQTDPQAAAATVSALLSSDGPFKYQFHTDQPSKFDPKKFWQLGYGVCAEYHIFGAALMQAAGLNAHPVEIFGGGLSHVVFAWQDPKSGGWIVQDYGNSKATSPPQASLEAAIAAYEPNYSTAQVLQTKGGMPTVYKTFVSPQHVAGENFVTGRY